MAKMAIGLFKDSATGDMVVKHLLESGFSRDEIRLVRRSDFDGTPGPETDTSGGDTADRAVGIMDQDGAIAVDKRTAKPVESGGARAASSADPGFYPRRPAAHLFEGRQHNSSRFHEDLPLL